MIGGLFQGVHQEHDHKDVCQRILQTPTKLLAKRILQTFSENKPLISLEQLQRFQPVNLLVKRSLAGFKQ